MCTIDVSIQRSFLARIHPGTVLLLGCFLGAVIVLWSTLQYVEPTPQEKMLSLVMQMLLWCLKAGAATLKGGSIRLILERTYIKLFQWILLLTAEKLS